MSGEVYVMRQMLTNVHSNVLGVSLTFLISWQKPIVRGEINGIDLN